MLALDIESMLISKNFMRQQIVINVVCVHVCLRGVYACMCVFVLNVLTWKKNIKDYSTW